MRRIEFAYAKPAALHYNPGACICEEVDQNLGGFWQNLGDLWQILDQNLGGFWQNLGDSWQNIASENATAFAKNNVKKS